MNANVTIAEPSATEPPVSEDAKDPREDTREAVDPKPRDEESTPEGAVPVVPVPAVQVPEPRPAVEADGEAERGKSKKPRRAVRAKSAGGTKSLVVWREGRLYYADDSVLVVDLDEAASPDTDVHDVVDRLTELRDAVDSAGRTEIVAALGEIIQEKALN